MSNSTRNKLIITFVLLLGTVGLFLSVVYFVKERGDDLSTQNNLIAKERAQESSRLRLQSIENGTKEDRARLQKYFLNDRGDNIGVVNDMISSVEGMANQLSLKIEITRLEVIELEGEKWLEAGFLFEGSKGRVRDFVRLLENLPYFTVMSNLRIENRSTSQSQAEITMKIKMLAYD